MRQLINRIRRHFIRKQLISVSQQLHNLPKEVIRELDINRELADQNARELMAAWDHWQAELEAEQKRLALKLAALSGQPTTNPQGIAA